MMTTKASTVDYSGLLDEALTGPVSRQKAAYAAFWRFSALNRALAAKQLAARGLEISPLATYKRWQRQGIQVRKGQKALSLWMPVKVKAEAEAETEAETEAKAEGRVVFAMRANWFSLSQTDKWGEDGVADLSVPPEAGWCPQRAVKTLGVSLEAFGLFEAATTGYSYKEKPVVAVSPLAEHPIGVLVHELAHQLMHNHGEGRGYQHSAKEMEAEATAFIVCSTLGLLDDEAASSSRAYIQHYAGEYGQDEKIRAAHARRIFSAVDKILKAGQQPPKDSAVGEAK